MTVNLSIENDEELRAYAKDLIRGQYLSFAREEVQKMVYEELTSKIGGLHTSRFEQWIKEALRKAIENILYKEHNIAGWRKDFIAPYIETYVSKMLAEAGGRENLVYQLAKQITGNA